MCYGVLQRTESGGGSGQDAEHAVNNAAVMFMAGLTKRRLTLPTQPKDDDMSLVCPI